jgi:voltage-gated potassium channel
MDPYTGGPDATRLSLAVDIVVLACIILSCSLIVVELIHPEHTAKLNRIELVFTGIFIVEYLLRWYAARNRWLYPFQALAILDLLAILPSLLTIGSGMLMLRVARGARLLRLLRLLRLVRLLRLLRYGPLIYRGFLHARVWLSSVSYQYRLHQLVRLFVWAAVVLAIGANMVFLTETAFGGQEGPFGRYWRSYWSIIIVLISGIEDKEPVTLLGRIEVTTLLIAGIVIVGMLTGEIVSILIRRVQRAGKVVLKPPSARLERHIVILGKSSHVDNIVRQVQAALHGLHHVLVVDPEADQLAITDPKIYRQVFALRGEPRETRILEEAGIDRAARVIVLAAAGEDCCDLDDADNRVLMATVAVVCRKKGVPLSVELLNEDSLRYTRCLPEVDFVVGRAYGERLISQAVLSPGVTEVYDHLLTFTGDSNEIYSIRVPEELVGKTFAEAQIHYLEDDSEAVTLIGIDRSPPAQPSSVFNLCPQAPQAEMSRDELILKQGDRLLVMAYHRPARSLLTRDERWRQTCLERD